MSQEEIAVEGLSSAASIVVDRWGIAHIRAETFLDMFFVQGFNAARDRLWQIDLWRKRGLGLLAADFGPGYLEQDRAARLFLYRGDMQAEWDAYAPDAEAICRHFAAGINAYVELCERQPQRLPPEFAALGTRPAKWQPEDVVRIRSHSLMRNAVSEVIRSNILAELDAELDALRQKLEPPHDPLAGRDRPAPLPLDCLDTFKLAIAPVTFGGERLAAGIGDARAWRKMTPLGDVVRDTSLQGSNNWVVSGARTASGRPILANDPHRTHAVPSLRYIVHIASPEFNGIGAGEPALPGISIGHNGHSAFGLTLFLGHDQEDVYVYETHPEDPGLYRYGDGWEAFLDIGETASVKGCGEAALALRFTRHGPVIAEYPERRLAVAIRTVWTDPGTAPYFKSIAAMRATSFEAFRGHMGGWGVPAVNQVYADAKGDIGWAVGGFSPIRPTWDGLLPVPGDGRHEWQGFLPGHALPFSHNPAKGYFATANEFNLPADWPMDQPIGYEWLEPSRAQRIDGVLAADERHSVDASRRLQTDVFSVPAKRVVGLLSGLSGRNEAETAALGLLGSWDFRLAADSPGAALYEVWWANHLHVAIIADAVGKPELRPLFAPGDTAGILDRLEALAARAPGEFAALALGSLAKAYDTCRRMLGPDTGEWAWGRVHEALFEHPAGAIANAKGRWDVGPFPFGGSGSTPMNGSYRPTDFRLTIGASFRIVVDVGDWDNSVCINTPGQSGDPRSDHYGDMAPLWAVGDYVPLLYTDRAVDAAAVLTLKLTPRRAA
ncbi:penicillin acylase family protein [Mesorhizobium sp. VK25A]|uniref:Penicillin acylase family protein n=1 Tax=Mesorhizobium vachelliae TaxID=3072309 RepID=A0ABU5A6A4_9HYPH|nr:MULTISPECIES: penicillin acylase family protein [unclassified Mesorhizobium]MDX8533235.1 penicillin acylase family protein [Mesorhizobium sp. VK25D]MDX8545154.1 penicillin acylase family protein [Mesorhizobium sp. VK25A]